MTCDSRPPGVFDRSRRLAPVAQTNGLERPLPHNLEAERSILGAILLDQHALNAAVQKLRSKDFFLEQHRRIFERMVQLGEKQQAIDTVTLMDDLKRRDELEAAGGVAYLSQLADGLPRGTNVPFYAEIVASRALRRRLIHFADNLYEAGFDDSQPICELLAQAATQIAQVRERAQLTAARSWREKFHTVSELPDGDNVFLIDRILPEGITFLGALSGVGKTWLALGMARALTKGEKFLGLWDVPEPTDVVYLCPEMSAKTFKRRCQRFGIRERFYCQTIADGAPLDLTDSLLTAAVRELRPVVFLDTAIRFSNAEDENSAAENQELARSIFSLLYDGARAVVCLHHRAKDTARAEEMTLENCLRGTGDLGAVAAAVYGIRYEQFSGNAAYLKESRKLVRLEVRCVKARDFVPVEDFRVQLDPHIDILGDFAVLSERAEDPRENEAERVERAISENNQASLRQIANAAGVNKNRVKSLASESGWSQGDLGWTHE
jgi:DnaB-like helicase N terminal domain/AAA domain